MDGASDTEERLEAAITRIEAALARLGASDASGEADRMRQALDDERLANAQLMERVKAIKERQETQVSELEAKVKRLSRTLALQEATLTKLREVNDTLRANNTALREANAAGVGNPELINAGLEEELKALRSARAADKAEMDEVMGELGALLGGEK